MREWNFYQAHLDAVSRSFALCIPQLEPPFREQVALSYLLLRVLDTIEDAPFSDKQLQSRQFERFRKFLREPPTPEQEKSFRAAFPREIPESESALLADCKVLFEELQQVEHAAQGAMVSCIDRMAQGMALYEQRPAVRLLDLEDVVRYCCIVAGLVGELLTKLHPGPQPQLLHAYQFGLFLQKVNILKDQREDEAAKRFFVPDREELMASVRDDAQGAVEYICSLPAEARGYRTFCAWSLVMGADSLAQQAGPRSSRRAQTMQLLGRAAECAQDNSKLRTLFFETLPPLPNPPRKPGVVKAAQENAAFRKLMSALTDPELRAIGAQYG